MSAEAVQETRLGRYRLGTLLGRGNRASVYRATLEGGGPQVTIRVFDRELSGEAEFTDRFRRRAGGLAAIRHPHLLPVVDFGEYEGQAFLVRPFVAGSTLRQKLGAPLPLETVLALLRPIAAGLDHAHQQGFVHGDVKPGHILLPRSGEVFLADLGIAELLPRGNSLLMAATGRSYGTPEYLSPEQAHALALDGRMDQYALGVIAYEALVGRPPFRAERPGDTPRVIAARHITAPPPSPRGLNPAISAAAERVLLQVLDKDPARRFPACLDFLAELTATEPAAAGRVITGPMPPPPPASFPTPPPSDVLPFALPTDPDDEVDTGVLAPEALAASEPEDLALDRLAAHHAAELRAITASYEAQLAAHSAALRDQEATIAALTRQLEEAREERLRLVAELGAMAQERESLQAGDAPDDASDLPEAEEAVGQIVLLEPHLYNLPRNARYTLRGDGTVGRHPDSAVLIDEAYVSAHHAQLIHEPDGWWITDLGTKNGTYVNGTRIAEPTRLHPGDALRFGRVRAKFN